MVHLYDRGLAENKSENSLHLSDRTVLPEAASTKLGWSLPGFFWAFTNRGIQMSSEALYSEMLLDAEMGSNLHLHEPWEVERCLQISYESQERCGGTASVLPVSVSSR